MATVGRFNIVRIISALSLSLKMGELLKQANIDISW